jgi:hypothetical protein
MQTAAVKYITIFFTFQFSSAVYASLMYRIKWFTYFKHFHLTNLACEANSKKSVCLLIWNNLLTHARAPITKSRVVKELWISANRLFFCLVRCQEGRDSNNKFFPAHLKPIKYDTKIPMILWEQKM